MSTLESKASPPGSYKRRRYTLAFKRRLIESSDDPEQSVARIAQQHGVNPNLLHKWRRQLRSSNVAAVGGDPGGQIEVGGGNFVRLPRPLSSSPAPVSQTMRIELPDGVVLHWPLDQLSESADWLKRWSR
ncbi:MAG: transposase [Gammaproteobacteria bacterium]|nr:transposase [Gammaproteobacteria bacterium]